MLFIVKFQNSKIELCDKFVKVYVHKEFLFNFYSNL